jgi:uncharacterized delta-60 repeat protein
VTSARLLPDGKIVVAGNDGVTGKIIRLNTDGSVDPNFVVSFGGIGTQSESFSVEAVQPDGKILATRRSSASGSYLLRVYRFNTNGAEDLSFTPFTVAESFGGTASVRIELLSDGRFYLTLNVTNAGGNIGGVSRRNADGSVDSTWQSPSILSAPGLPADVFIYDLAVAPDGGVFAVGRFSIVNGLEKQGFVKLLPAGNVDVGFPAPPTSASRLYILPDGKILIAGSSISRLNSDGTLDNTFTMDPAVGSLRSRFDVDSNQRIVLFAQMAVGIRLIRLLPNGGLDGTFQTSIATYGQVRATAVQADGKVLVAGVFSHIGGVPRSSFARVNSGRQPRSDVRRAFFLRPTAGDAACSARRKDPSARSVYEL